MSLTYIQYCWSKLYFLWYLPFSLSSNIPTAFHVYIKVLSVSTNYSKLILSFFSYKKSLLCLKLLCRQIIRQAIFFSVTSADIFPENTHSKVYLPIDLICRRQCCNTLGWTDPQAISHKVCEPPGKGERGHSSVVWGDSHLPGFSWQVSLMSKGPRRKDDNVTCGAMRTKEACPILGFSMVRDLLLGQFYLRFA